MLRFGVTGVLVAMGALAGCQDLKEPGASTTEQALGAYCSSSMPPLIQWDGSAIKPAGPNGIYVFMPYVEGMEGKGKQAAVAEDTGKSVLVLVNTEEEQATDGYVVKNDDPKLPDLREYMMRGPIIVPGEPPEPCYQAPWLCGQAITLLAIDTMRSLQHTGKGVAACGLQ